MSLIDKIRGFREGLNNSVYRKTAGFSPGLAEMLVSDVKMPKVRPKILLYSGTMLLAGSFYLFGCGGGGGGGGNSGGGTPPATYQCNDHIDNDGDGKVDYPADPDCSSATDDNELDVAAPGAVTDLLPNALTGNVEKIQLNWTSPGDDGWTGAPNFFLLKYRICPDLNDCPISTETDWQNATDLGTVNNAGSAGTVYSPEFIVPPGHLCFAIKTYDEVNNASPISNSSCADVISKAQWFVDFFLPTGRMYLDYDEVESMMQGVPALGIPSKALDVGTILATVTAPPYDTPAAMEAYLKKMTDTIYDPPNNNYEVCSKAIGGMVQSALDWENINIPKSLSLHARAPPTDCSPGYLDQYTPLTDQNMIDLRNIIRDHLILWVDNNKVQYCNLTAPCAEGEEWSINH